MGYWKTSIICLQAVKCVYAVFFIFFSFVFHKAIMQQSKHNIELFVINVRRRQMLVLWFLLETLRHVRIVLIAF